MTQRLFAKLAMRAVCSLLLLLLGGLVSQSKLWWIGVPFFSSGFLISQLIPNLFGSFGPDLLIHLLVGFSLSFLVNWIIVLAVAKLLGEFIARKRARMKLKVLLPAGDGIDPEVTKI